MKEELKNSKKYISSKVGKTTSFTTPNNYFKSVEDSFLLKLAEEKFPEKAGYYVPEDYFNKLDTIVLSKVTNQKKKTRVVSLKQKLLRIIPLAAAASILLFVGLNSFVFNTEKQITIDSISDADIESWLTINNLHYNDIALVLQEDILNDNEFSMANIQNETIEEYIISTDNTNLLNEGY